MKAVLFLCLLAFMTCEKDIIDIGKCLYKDPKVKEIIADVMVAIATKDFDKLLTQIKEALPDLIKALAGCVLETKVVEDTPKLNYCSKHDYFIQHMGSGIGGKNAIKFIQKIKIYTKLAIICA